MKLISLYIENFGGLSQYALSFEAGITCVAEPNGFGKTTLAEFIRAMFYGFPRKSKTLDKSRRQKYAPWNGGQYGGNLVFEYQGQRYRMERTFGANPKADTFSVIDLTGNRKTNRFAEEIGLQLFGLDADSFERSTYLPQAEEDGPLATAWILSKLSDLVEDTSDVAGYDKAVAALRAKRSGLLPYRGSGGSMAGTAAEITQLQLEMDAASVGQGRLHEAQEEATRAQSDAQQIKMLLAQNGAKMLAASRQETDRLRREQYTQLCSRRRGVAEQIDSLRNKYPRGMPQEDILHRGEIAAERLKRSEKAQHDTAAPPPEDLNRWREACAQYAALQDQTRDLQQRMTALMHAQSANFPPVQAGRSKAPLAVAMAGLAGILAGGGLFLVWEPLYGLIAAGVGLLILLAGAACASVQRRKQHAQERELYQQRQETELKLSGIRRQIDARNRAGEKCRMQIDEFLRQYGLHVQPDRYAAALMELERRSLQDAQQKADADAAREELQELFGSLGLEPAQDILVWLQQLRTDMRALHGAQTLAEELAAQIRLIEETCPDVLYCDTSAQEDLRQLQQQEQQLRAELTAATTRVLQAQQNVRNLREEAARLPALQEELKQQQDKLAQERSHVEILDAAIDFLRQAKENLATAYMGTIRARFGHYLSLLEESADEGFLVDPELRVQLQRQGQTRELAYFSAGQTDLVMLCMRLALVDALFKEQEMFLILDDPFINLDDVHMEKARKLLRMLAGEHQILYLTCHSSRTI